MTELPKLGDRNIKIQLTNTAISSYQQGILKVKKEYLSKEDATNQLYNVLLKSYVIYSSGETLRTRARIRSLHIDVQTDLIRISANHIKAFFTEVRFYRALGGSGKTQTIYGYPYKIRNIKGKAVGYLRITDNGIEYRKMNTDKWIPVPFNVDKLANFYYKRGFPALKNWLMNYKNI